MRTHIHSRKKGKPDRNLLSEDSPTETMRATSVKKACRKVEYETVMQSSQLIQSKHVDVDLITSTF